MPTPALAECLQWPIRGSPYDGDTIGITLPLPVPLDAAAVRVRGVDAPEMRGECQAERDLAARARSLTVSAIIGAERIEFCEPEWDRYGGRVVATVRIDGRDLAELLIAAGVARIYDGGRREPWCP